MPAGMPTQSSAEMPTDWIDNHTSDFHEIFRVLGVTVQNMKGIWRPNFWGKGGKAEPLNDALSLRATLFVPIAASAESL